MKRLHALFLLLGCASLSDGARADAGPPPHRPPNVLLIVADDLKPCLGCYGHPLVKSPHLDRLAASGVRFERAYAQAPLCNPSRVSLLTGRYPPSTGVMRNRQSFRRALPDIVTLPEHFRAHGYVTARAGKIFHPGLDDQRSWTARSGAERARDEKRPERAPEKGEAYERRLDRWEAVEGGGEELRDHRIASRAIELLRAYRDRPFFLAVGLSSPHAPLIAPRRYFDLYPPDRIALPPDFALEISLPADVPARALAWNGDLFVVREPSERAARETIAAYYASVSFLDAQVGRVLDELGRLGLAERTIVVFLGDHGFHLGEKGKWSKHHSFFEPALRVPLIVAAPGAARGSVSPRTVELVDLYPTLLSLAGLPPRDGLEGQSFRVLLREPEAVWNHEAYSYGRTPIGFAASVRNERFRYTEWNDGRAGASLYDYGADPHEQRNLVADPAHAEVVQHLRRRLRAAATWGRVAAAP